MEEQLSQKRGKLRKWGVYSHTYPCSSCCAMWHVLCECSVKWDDVLLKEAAVINAEVEQEQFIREQEVVAAQRRCTVAAEQKMVCAPSLHLHKLHLPPFLRGRHR